MLFTTLTTCTTTLLVSISYIRTAIATPTPANKIIIQKDSGDDHLEEVAQAMSAHGLNDGYWPEPYGPNGVVVNCLETQCMTICRQVEKDLAGKGFKLYCALAG
ncbi:hypothetical protein QBC35DRAFT_453360 [Podospora australis]|uniref:Uncharacterized protein n=1 Tax=Podospora australis TaxID=1536484 RepID=A0AAN6WQJ5_9PEZI|nr:hypothetical protein QBC35DRAFT_453360 [Podospora australis]